MRLRAESIGYAVPCVDFEARIHSVFQTAVNLRPAHQDLLLTIVVAGEADLPQGIRLDSPDDLPFEQLIVGKSVFCRDETLFFEDSDLQVDLHQCKQWQCDLPALAIDLSNPAVGEAWKFVWKLLNERQVKLGAEIVAEALFHPDGMAGSAISRRVGKAVRILVEAARNHQPDNLSVLTQLIGLGTGLTPCGDDFLVGYLAGLWCTVRESVERRRFLSELRRAVIQLSAKTNDISRTYLEHAANGQVSSRLEELAAAISKPKSLAQVLTATEAAMHTGHTSGVDGVTGLLSGLATWEGEAVLVVE
jgi:hypothetical protein